MWKRIAQSIAGLILTVLALWVVFALAMRAKFPPVLTAIRRINRAVTNPRAMETAGRPGAYASVIQHLGRTTGTAYETPIGPLLPTTGS
jgi:hypothetical protein